MSNFINPLLIGNAAAGLLENNNPKISAKHLACAGVSTLIIGAVLKKTGHNKAGNLLAGLALPLLTSACYKKFKAKKSENVNKSTDITGNFYEG
ncbi:PrgI family protein [Flavobacterium sp. 1355]|jgi:hypothetical protein|uniref:PrgI family protein n=1 Tax=Flavobacterium sp. 1355 TaxID=2806571 RepID=UPI001AE52689|nr:PrgI family protein [Flavobacterium sp. 1355]MBP1221660.1 hypothetical protein [Flavobacterium sp. 1355]